MENNSPRLCLRYDGAIVQWISGHIPGYAGGSRQLKSHRLSWPIHGVAEVIERSTVVVIDHICQRILKRASAPWGRYRTPRTERITADIAIMSMLYESTAIVSINGFFHLYQFIYMKNISHWAVLLSFTKLTTVPLAIEWLFASMSLAIETRYQNLAVMAVWRKDWRRHFLVALLNLLPLAFWASPHLFIVVQARFKVPLHEVPCKHCTGLGHD